MAEPANPPNPWGKVGSWAADAEAEESAAAAAAAAAAIAPPELFPSLKEAASGAGKSKKKAKGTTLSLTEFTSGKFTVPSSRRAPETPSRGLTPEELLQLPTGPRERSAEELEQARSRGFRLRDDDRPPRTMDFDLPSRADESDNWGSSKRSTQFSSDTGRRGGSSEQYSGPSRADEINDWNSGKRTMAPAPPVPGRYRDGPKFDSRAADSDRWVRGQVLDDGRDGLRFESKASDSDRWVRGQVLDEGPNRDRPKLVLNPPKRDGNATSVLPAAEPTRNRSSLFGAARPREEVLAEKGVDWKKMETETEGRESLLISERSSRPGTAGSIEDDAAKPRPKVNPFGAAKPREVVLQEKGLDWKKMDLGFDHRVERPETQQEKKLEEEIEIMTEQLKDAEARLSAGVEDTSAEDVQVINEKLLEKKKELQLLIHDSDEKKTENGSLSGSGGKVTTSSTAAATESSRVTENIEHARWRGGKSEPSTHGNRGETLSRPVEGWGFNSNREGREARDSFGTRAYDRPMLKQKW